MVRSKIDRKRKIIEDRKRSEKDLLSKRRKIEKDTGETEENEKENEIKRPDEIIGLIIFLVIPNILLPLVSFIFTLILLFWLLFNNDMLFYWFLASALLYIGTVTLTGLTSYWLYRLRKFSYYIAIGIAFLGLIINVNMLFVLNPMVIIVSIISIILNGLCIYFLLFYQEIRAALQVRDY